jgi:hypothetical protein
MSHVGARFHAFYNGLFRAKPHALALTAYEEIEAKLKAENLFTQEMRLALARQLVQHAVALTDATLSKAQWYSLFAFAETTCQFEEFFVLPEFDWSKRHSVSEYWELQDRLKRQRNFLSDLEETKRLITLTFFHVISPILAGSPKTEASREDEAAICVPTELIHAIANLPAVIESVNSTYFVDDLRKAELFNRHRDRLEANLIAASGGNPADPKGFSRTPKLPTQSDIKAPEDLVEAYLGGTPALNLFAQTIDFAIPQVVRFEHQHIVAGSGHGKTQTLQFLIAQDLNAVERRERSVVVIDSQGDLIRRISHLKQFAPGEPLHDRIVLIDPTDVEWPVSLNLFDIGLERLNQYSKLDRERLTNSIIELYDFVLGSLLSAEMTQKQNIIFRYVTRLMLQIPDATIQTLRELMEPKSELKFAPHIEKLTGSAREFFRTEFGTSEFSQTRRQVLRRLWGILENQSFERMFSHPRSKLDLFTEMNAGKVILINTAKDLLKESGTEIFGRFFIALIAQAAQERATLKERDRMPTMVYIDEAADYFDRNVGIILSQARKYNVGMVLAHQYMGQLEAKLQDAIAANTSIKFAGGVSTKDARVLAPMMGCSPELIEAQSKGSFAAFVRGVTKSAIPLKFPLGYMEDLPQMTGSEFNELRALMRKKYAVHYSELETPIDQDNSEKSGHEPNGVTSKEAESDSKRIISDSNDDAAKAGW